MKSIRSWIENKNSHSKGDTTQASFASPVQNAVSDESVLSSAMPVPGDTPIEQILEVADATVRLNNVFVQEDFPFRTVDSFLSSSDPRGEVRKIQNSGKKTANEFVAIIEKFLEDEEFQEACLSRGFKDKDALEPFIKKSGELLNYYPFPEVVLKSRFPLSVRLSNVLTQINDRHDRRFQTFRDCICNHNDFKSYIRMQPNTGKKTLKELDSVCAQVLHNIFVSAGIEESMANDLVPVISKLRQDSLNHDLDIEYACKKIEEHVNKIKEQYQGDDENTFLLSDLQNREYDLSHEGIVSSLKHVLNEKEFEIISQRFALVGSETLTLEAISKSFQVTRERIRQLERNALKKIRRPLLELFQQYVQNSYEKIDNTVFETQGYLSFVNRSRAFNNLDGFKRLAIRVVFEDDKVYMDERHLIYKDIWISRELEDEKAEEIKILYDEGTLDRSIKSLIAREISASTWPVNVNALSRRITTYDADEIHFSLVNDFQAEIQNGEVLKIENGLSAAQRLILVFRHKGQALTPGQIRPIHKEFFGQDMLEHHIGGVLGGLEEALIVSRGTYDIYENLSLSEEDLKDIRGSSFRYLKGKSSFISSKIIFRDVFKGSDYYGPDFNPYMLLGILQDDKRFVCKRGMMIGLEDFSSEKFSSLTSQLYGVVNDHGPISVNEIQRYLNDERELLTVTIGMILDSAQNYIKVRPGTYDRIDRVVGNDKNQKQLEQALEIALFEGAQDLKEIKSRLAKVNIVLDTHVIASFADTKENFKRRRQEVGLLVPSSEFVEYNRVFSEQLKVTSSRDSLKKTLGEKLNREMTDLIYLDYRLSEKYYKLLTSNDSYSQSNELKHTMKPVRLTGKKRAVDV